MKGDRAAALRRAWSAWRQRWKRRKLLWRCLRAGRALMPMADRTAAIRPGDILAFATVRNEMLRLPQFLDHYRQLGVRMSRHGGRWSRGTHGADHIQDASVRQSVGVTSRLEPGDHAVAQLIILEQLGPPSAATGEVLGIHVPVTSRHRHFVVVPEVAPDLAMDSGAMSAELDGDLRHADLALQHGLDNATLRKGHVRCQREVPRTARSQQIMACRISK
ncbi:hypothetical protein [Paracoccus benzoatiresistens]|uniref:Uncharacterized protein n=1 Tax=Paracoccus benzoatiresistens TaxID=2997341 RepID=A0ABT4J5G9_9RHOB|nr:hypothetical protein [Paracoccus sp. EF6]MCZ0962373.1 hypothetical protein [Paracoccus sp. EF6]